MDTSSWAAESSGHGEHRGHMCMSWETEGEGRGGGRGAAFPTELENVWQVWGHGWRIKGCKPSRAGTSEEFVNDDLSAGYLK